MTLRLLEYPIIKITLYHYSYFYWIQSNHIRDIMDSVFASSAVDHWFESWSGQTKDYKIDICSFSTKHAALLSKIKR